MVIHQTILSTGDIQAVNPIAVFFLSMELLKAAQTVIEDLANQDRAIVVCSSIIDESRVRELGADYCLSHPFTYDNFYEALVAIGIAKHV